MGRKLKSGNNGYSLLVTLIMMITVGAMAIIWFVNSPMENGAVQTQTVSVASGSYGFEVHYINVGQGDSELIICGNEAMLIDAGEKDAAEGIIKYIKGLGITELKYVVATHPHSDHIGGIAAVLDEFDVKDFIAPDVSHTTKTFENMLDAIERNNLEITIAKPLDVYALGDAAFTVLSPCGEDYGELNNYSVVIKVDYKSNSFLFTGDAQGQAETEMLEAGYDLKSDILKVGHHGSSTSTTARFLSEVSPQYAVISCGADNSYNHPHNEVVQRLLKNNVTVYQTKDDGTVVVKSDGNEISIETSE